MLSGKGQETLDETILASLTKLPAMDDSLRDIRRMISQKLRYHTQLIQRLNKKEQDKFLRRMQKMTTAIDEQVRVIVALHQSSKNELNEQVRRSVEAMTARLQLNLQAMNKSFEKLATRDEIPREETQQLKTENDKLKEVIRLMRKEMEELHVSEDAHEKPLVEEIAPVKHQLRTKAPETNERKLLQLSNKLQAELRYLKEQKQHQMKQHVAPQTVTRSTQTQIVIQEPKQSPKRKKRPVTKPRIRNYAIKV